MNFKTYIVFLLLFISCSENIINNNQSYDINFGSESSLDIVTWNLEFFPKHEETIEYLLDFIPNINSDIYALQEITDQESFNLLVNQLGKYAEDKNYIQTIHAVIKKNSFDKFNSKTISY